VAITSPSDDDFMALALDAARVAATHDDVPVGCVVVVGNEVVATGENRREIDADPTAHAEIVALRAAAGARGRWRLDDATVYVTVEPCVMCAGALVNARVARVVIGALDEKAGAAGSRYNLLADPRLLHEVSVTYDVGTEASVELLREFFLARRDAEPTID
jgi:tRNA(adenine34) deaminase